MDSLREGGFPWSGSIRSVDSVTLGAEWTRRQSTPQATTHSRGQASMAVPHGIALGRTGAIKRGREGRAATRQKRADRILTDPTPDLR